LCGGFVSGLAGFGTGLVALGIWLHVIPPATATALVLICSVAAQCQTIPKIWHAVDVGRIWPMVAAGIVGVPFGVTLLAHVDPGAFRFGIGGFLILFSAVMLIGGGRITVAHEGRLADVAIGFGGGVLGGLAGLSGPLPTMWATLRGWGKDQRRGVFQTFNLVVLAMALIVLALKGMVAREALWLVVWALPGTFAGAWLGHRCYRRLSDHHFQQLVLMLLGVSGLTLIWPVLFAG
jgi:hypothetical protein